MSDVFLIFDLKNGLKLDLYYSEKDEHKVRTY